MSGCCRWGAGVALVLLASLPGYAQDTAAPSPGSVLAITAERTAQRTDQSVAATTVITAEEIRDNGIQSIADVLRFVPGVSVERNGGFGAPTYARVHGTATNQLLVLVNGKRVSTPSFGAGTDLSRFTMEEISRIEVVRGALSSLYGSDAIGGAINIVTKQKSERRNEANLGWGSNGRDARSLSLNGGGKLDWRVSADTPAFGGDRANSRYSATHFGVGIDLPAIKGWDVSVRQSRYQDTLGLPGPSVGKLATTGPPTAVVAPSDPDDHQWTTRDNYGVSATRALGKGNLGFGSYRIQDSLRQILTGHGMDSSADVTGTTDVSDFNYRFTTERHDVVTGVEVRTEKYDVVDTLQSVATNKDITNRGVYIQDRWILDGNTHMVVGTRFDDHSVAGNVMSPRIGIIRALSGGFKLRASYAEGFRSPGFVELYGAGSVGTGNPNLKAERSRQYELALNSTKGDDFVEVTLFNDDIRDGIVLLAGAYQNAVRSRQRGLELTWQHRVSPTGRFTASYTYLDAEDRDSGQRSLGVPRNLWQLSVEGELEAWKACLLGDWHDNRLGTFGTRLPGKPTFDLSFVRIGQEQRQPYVIIRNLTNTTYQDVPGYLTDGTSIEAGVRSIW